MTGEITQSDVQTFAAKLEAFAQDLSPVEQAMLAEMLTAAKAGKGEVQGYAGGDHIKKAAYQPGPEYVRLSVTPLILSYWS